MKNQMNYQNRVELFTKVANIEILSQAFGIPSEDVVEFVCGDEHTFSMWYKLYNK